jgi:hypothetical protein
VERLEADLTVIGTVDGIEGCFLMRTLANATRSYLRLSQISLLTLLLVCSLLIPSVSEGHGGVSNFGDHVSTVVPYILSFSLSILFLCLAAKQVRDMGTGFRSMADLLLVIAFLELLVLISTFPRRISPGYYEVHDWLGVALYAYEFALSLWFVTRERSVKILGSFTIEVFGSALGLLSSLKVIHLLYYGQIIGALGFGVLLVAAFPNIIDASCVAEEVSETVK